MNNKEANKYLEKVGIEPVSEIDVASNQPQAVRKSGRTLGFVGLAAAAVLGIASMYPGKTIQQTLPYTIEKQVDGLYVEYRRGDNYEEIKIYNEDGNLEASLMDSQMDGKVDEALCEEPFTYVDTVIGSYPADMTSTEKRDFLTEADSLFKVVKEELNIK